MGLLAETKIRRAINTDPNNTKWTRDTSTFGQKILRSQGWQPGQFLGAQDAPHSNLHTSANATYIRVSLKDDMKGLGFDKAKDNEATGMDVFNDLLSRLNGKSSAAIAEDRQARLVVKMHRYVEQKWGPMRFVRGGLLVGDELKVDEEEAQKEEEPAAEKAKAESEPSKEKKSKKRKAASLDDEDDDSETGASDSDSNSKKRKKEARKSKKRSKEVDASDMNESQDDSSKLKKKDKKEKKANKQKKEKASKKEENDSNDDSTDDKVSKRKSKTQPEGLTVSPSEDEAAKAKKKKEKKERKERRKEEKKQKKSKVESSSSSASGTSTPTAATDGTPAGSGTSTPRRNPHLVRSRFIAAKREALLDDKALKQILMIKT